MRKYSQRSLNSLKGVHPDLRRVIDRALQESPVDFIVIEGLRSEARQRELVASGASKTMNSRHLTGHAVDLLPIGSNGPEFAWPLYNKLGPAVEAAAQAEGVPITWGGRWSKFRDGPHFELKRDAYPEDEWSTDQKLPVARTSPTQSKTVQASALQLLTATGGGVGAISQLEGTSQIVAIACAAAIAAMALFIMRERLRKWIDGVR